MRARTRPSSVTDELIQKQYVYLGTRITNTIKKITKSKDFAFGELASVRFSIWLDELETRRVRQRTFPKTRLTLLPCADM